MLGTNVISCFSVFESYIQANGTSKHGQATYKQMLVQFCCVLCSVDKKGGSTPEMTHYNNYFQVI